MITKDVSIRSVIDNYVGSFDSVVHHDESHQEDDNDFKGHVMSSIMIFTMSFSRFLIPFYENYDKFVL